MKDYQPSFSDEADRLEALTKLNDPLVDLNRLINFEMFRPRLEAVFNKEKKNNAGRKPFDVVLMFKMLILQRLYNLSDEQTEYQGNDGFSFQRFLGLRLGNTVPDFSTVWRFREALTEVRAVKPLFDEFTALLEQKCVITKRGTIVDASFVEVPVQRNTSEENEKIKDGVVPEEWKNQPAKLSQKDADARWTKKNEVSFFGYKNHVKADADSKMIKDYRVTPASVHDSQVLPEPIAANESGGRLFADSAYKSKETDARLDELEIGNFVHEKAGRNRPLNKNQIELNRQRSSIRCRVEHVFGFFENSMGGPELEYIGIQRIATGIGLGNLAYNFLRYVQLVKLGLSGVMV